MRVCEFGSLYRHSTMRAMLHEHSETTSFTEGSVRRLIQKNARSGFGFSSMSNHVEYELIIRQQPMSARMSGFANPQDVRLLSPALILQVIIHDNGTKRYTAPDIQEQLLCKIVLSENLDAPTQDLYKREAPIPNGYDSNLLGTPIAPCQVLLDLEETGRQGMLCDYRHVLHFPRSWH
ncbi:hypothetical protein EDD86DRAFT_102359 [Gorgonomyces haynaldii]|nr:hypothetical protein EDD86DRAFT_102359 [Gorgonomyces haynaldii]